MNKPTFFDELYTLDVNNHVEERGGLRYLGWGYAWAELKKRFPLSYATVHETPEGSLVWRDPIGGHVKTSVTLVWFDSEGNRCEQTEWERLPIMDFRNKSVPYDNIDSMAVNKTIQRSITKAIARFGLGLYLYNSDELPEESEESKAEKAAKKAAAEAEAREVVEITAKIDAIVKEIVSDMSVEEKKAFGAAFVAPITGTANYKTCHNLEKLTRLYNEVADALKTKKDAAA